MTQIASPETRFDCNSNTSRVGADIDGSLGFTGPEASYHGNSQGVLLVILGLYFPGLLGQQVVQSSEPSLRLTEERITIRMVKSGAGVKRRMPLHNISFGNI
jgi:hypothetical protein